MTRDDLEIRLLAMTELAKAQKKDLEKIEERYVREQDESYWLLQQCLKKDKQWIVQTVLNAEDLDESIKKDILQYFDETGVV